MHWHWNVVTLLVMNEIMHWLGIVVALERATAFSHFPFLCCCSANAQAKRLIDAGADTDFTWPSSYANSKTFLKYPQFIRDAMNASAEPKQDTRSASAEPKQDTRSASVEPKPVLFGWLELLCSHIHIHVRLLRYIYIRWIIGYLMG